jgi:hypothetical protein
MKLFLTRASSYVGGTTTRGLMETSHSIRRPVLPTIKGRQLEALIAEPRYVSASTIEEMPL